MKKIAKNQKNQKAAAIMAETEMKGITGACPRCGMVLQLDRGLLIDPVVPQIELGGLGPVGFGG
jgi:hypothetical protein